MSKEYLLMKVQGKETHIRTDSLDRLRNIDAVIFDCDGVLIDVRESYNKAILETVTYIIKELTGFSIQKNVVSRKTIQSFRNSGGFNNDWDLTYAILVFILCSLPESFREVFKKCVSSNGYRDDLFERFLYVKDSVRREYSPQALDISVGKLEEELTRFADLLDVSGIDSIEKKLINLDKIPEDCLEYYLSTKDFLSHPGDVNESLVTRLFEEIFCGPQLFREVYGCSPRFFSGGGLIENERVIITPETLDKLSALLGGPNLGISSGRPLKLAKYTLDELLEKFVSEALVFLEDIKTAEENVSEKGSDASLKKPHPFSLFASSRELEPFRLALYVGDSMEDIILVKEANRVDSRFLSAGVYNHSDCKEEVIGRFLKADSDIILPSVNELPLVIKLLKEKKAT